MIKIVDGDLLKSSEDIIGHQVNCQGKMGAGIAKQLRRAYDNLEIQYRHLCETHSSSDLLGSVQFVEVNGGKYIANIFGQLNYGRDKQQYTNYLALEHGLKHLRSFAEENKLSVALPYEIGAGLGGGDWEVIYKMIEEAFEGYQVTLYKLI